MMMMTRSSSNTNHTNNDGQWNIAAGVLSALHKLPYLIPMAIPKMSLHFRAEKMEA